MHSVQTRVQSPHHPGATRELLRAEEVGELFKVDRSTVYRMAEGGRLPAFRIGRQWRFPADAIEHLVRAEHPIAVSADEDHESMERVVAASLPFIDVAARMLGVMIIATDMDGRPVGELVNPCPWFAEHEGEAEFMTTCLEFWKRLADDPDFAVGFHRGPLDVACARTFVRVGPRLVGTLLAGGVDPTGNDPRPLHRLSDEGRARVLAYLPMVAAAISHLAAGPEPGTETRSTT